MSSFSLDIETLGTPERSGYGIVIPNYAIVKIPEVLTSELEWLYVQLPIQQQLDLGLKVDANTMNFWFDVCAQEFPLALYEMQKSFKLNEPVISNSHGLLDASVGLSNVIKDFMYGENNPSASNKIYGNGCNFDCSILQENHRIMYNDANLWHYSSPNNVRTLRLLLTKDEDNEMHEIIEPYLEEFCDSINSMEIMYNLCLHNPLYDAAKEALFITYILNMKKSA